MATNEILLESGTNELEIAEFSVEGQSYGINVAKIRELIEYDPSRVNRMIGSPPSVLGTYNHRDKPVPLVSLHLFLGHDFSKLARYPILIITEFNLSFYAFLVDHVIDIHRISWADYSASHSYIQKYSNCVNGTFSINGREILMLDYESITNQIFDLATFESADVSRGGKDSVKPEGSAEQRPLRLLVIEDSRSIQVFLKASLSAAGIENVELCDNGQLGLARLMEIRDQACSHNRPVTESVDLIISDIEMPVMDGLTFCLKVKKDPELAKLPVIMFSSMINDEMMRKCMAVGASACISKPQIGILVDKVRELCQGKTA